MTTSDVRFTPALEVPGRLLTVAPGAFARGGGTSNRLDGAGDHPRSAWRRSHQGQHMPAAGIVTTPTVCPAEYRLREVRGALPRSALAPLLARGARREA